LNVAEGSDPYPTVAALDADSTRRQAVIEGDIVAVDVSGPKAPSALARRNHATIALA
jgi:hypothetical protein